MVEVRLVPMGKKEFEATLEAGIRRYAEENVKVGYWTPAEAPQRSRETHERLLPQGLRTEGHHFYQALDAADDRPVGHLWLRVEPGDDRKGFIFDVFIEEADRGKGYGRGMMVALEAKARRMKLSSLALHVFYYNEAAIHLYSSLGYEIKSMNMLKEL